MREKIFGAFGSDRYPQRPDGRQGRQKALFVAMPYGLILYLAMANYYS